MPDMDQGIKRLDSARIQAEAVLALTLPGADYLGTLPVDVAAEPRLALDTLLRVRYKGVECAVDLEAEARARPDMGRRLFEYGARHHRHRAAGALGRALAEPGGAPPPSPFELRVADRLIAHWHFLGIEVYKLPAEQLIAPGLPGLLPLVPFTADAATWAPVDARRNWCGSVPDREVNELANLLILFAGRRLDEGVLQALMRRLPGVHRTARPIRLHQGSESAGEVRDRA